jgi:hypothetical protein
MKILQRLINALKSSDAYIGIKKTENVREPVVLVSPPPAPPPPPPAPPPPPKPKFLVDYAKFFHGPEGVRKTIFTKGLSNSQVMGLQSIIGGFRKYQPNGSVTQLAYILATAHLETGATMRPVRETFARTDAQAKARLEASFAKGSLRWVKTPYWREGFYGRGHVQLTHRANYAGALRTAVLKEFGADILKNPDEVLRDDISVFILIEGMMKGLTGAPDFTRWSLEDFVTESKSDYFNARKVVNPGDYSSYEVIASLAVRYEKALKGAL